MLAVSMIFAITKSGLFGYNMRPTHKDYNAGRVPHFRMPFSGIDTTVRKDRVKFREHTLGKPVIMGYNTYKSLPQILDHRWNVVMTRRHYQAMRNRHVAENEQRRRKHELVNAPIIIHDSLHQAISLMSETNREIVVIGGIDLFKYILEQDVKATIPRIVVNRVYMTMYEDDSSFVLKPQDEEDPTYFPANIIGALANHVPFYTENLEAGADFRIYDFGGVVNQWMT